MNWRGFLKRFGIGLGAALALTAIPEAAIKALTQPEAAKRLACEYMRLRYYEHMRGRSLAQHPTDLCVSQGLFNAYQGELLNNQRFILAEDFRDGVDSLMFKGLRVTVDPNITRWEDLRFLKAYQVRYA